MTIVGGSMESALAVTSQQQASSADETSAAPPPTRMENTVATLPIVYGSIAFPLNNSNNTNKKTVESTHEWTLYLRGPNNEDLSQCIEKAVFHLHPSFANSVRELKETPYQVTERGWGEFEAQIRIYWKEDAKEQSTMVTHGIKLYPPPPNPNTPEHPPDAPVLAESYDEVVFTNPTERFFGQLQKVPAVPAIEYKHEEHYPKYSDADNFLALLEAKKFLSKELESIKERLDLVDTDLEKADAEIKVAQEKAKAAAAAAGTTTGASQPSQQQAGRRSSAKGAGAPAAKKAKTAAASAGGGANNNNNPNAKAAPAATGNKGGNKGGGGGGKAKGGTKGGANNKGTKSTTKKGATKAAAAKANKAALKPPPKSAATAAAAAAKAPPPTAKAPPPSSSGTQPSGAAAPGGSS